jgi:hypothetical protein
VTPIDEADRILREHGDPDGWPPGREARHALEWARDSLADALAEHAELLRTGFTPHAEDEAAALAGAEEKAWDCAVAFRRALRERAACADGETLIAARQMAGALL